MLLGPLSLPPFAFWVSPPPLSCYLPWQPWEQSTKLCPDHPTLPLSLGFSFLVEPPSKTAIQMMNRRPPPASKPLSISVSSNLMEEPPSPSHRSGDDDLPGTTHSRDAPPRRRRVGHTRRPTLGFLRVRFVRGCRSGRLEVGSRKKETN